MSICWTLLDLLNSTGHPMEDALLVAEAMQRGEDRDAVYRLFDALEATDCPMEAISIAVCELARKIIEVNASARPRGTGPTTPSPYKLRLGLSKGKWRRLRETIFERDGRKCQYCGDTEDLAIDHIVPLVRGGTNDPANLTPACRPCNSSKRDKLLEEWLGVN